MPLGQVHSGVGPGVRLGCANASRCPRPMTAGNFVPGLNQAQTLALQLLQNGNAGAAEDIIRPLLVHGMTDSLVPILAMIRLQQGRFAEAAQMFERARAIYPRDTRFPFLHGAALAGMGRLDKAVPAYQ